ncbi:uncharacterized protein PAF06_002860 [Gastrophryne carolinensis]
MVSVDLRKELECSICLSDYTDPVILKCGHNFCRVCIDRVLETQEEAGGYSCPECREEFQERPALIRNITLCNIIDNLLSTESGQSEIGVLCTYCIDSPVPAVKSCLHCEASLCERHLRAHSKSPEHVLTEPGTVLGNRKCSEHMEVLKYYCTEDSACVCVSCYVIGKHRGHQMESLDKASERKKKALKDVLQKVSIRRKETEGRVQSLQEHRKEAQQKATDMCERVTALFRELRIQVTELEKRVLSEVSRQEQQASLSLSHLIQQLEIKKDELSRKMRHIEELCNTTDPLTLLQEPDTGDLCDTEEGGNEDRETHDKMLSDGGNLDMSLLSQQFHTLSDIIIEVNVGIYMEGAADILLDVDTAHYFLHLSHDRKSVSYVVASQTHPETPKRFKTYPQVLSSCSFSSGRHYWEVDVGGACFWIIGMCYPSIDRERENESVMGRNSKSWALYRHYNKMTVWHDNKVTPLPAMISSNKVRINLDYEAGKISFYESGNSSRHLHTFTATFTEPLHAALAVFHDGCIKICGINTDAKEPKGKEAKATKDPKKDSKSLRESRDQKEPRECEWRNLEESDVEQWEKCPKVEAPLAQVSKRLDLSFDDMGSLRDPMDKRADILLKREWDTDSFSLRPLLAADCLSRVSETIQEGLRLEFLMAGRSLPDIRYKRLRMETVFTIREILFKGAWMASIDLQDAYLCILILPAHMGFLRFAVMLGIVTFHWQYRAMPFGLSSAPRIFTKILAEVMAFLRKDQIGIIAYLDDLLLFAPSRELLENNVKRTLYLLTELGWIINKGKSSLLPQTDCKYLGYLIKSLEERTYLPPPKIQKITSLSSCVQLDPRVSLRKIMVLLGLMSSAIPAVGWAQFHFFLEQGSEVIRYDYSSPRTSLQISSVVDSSRKSGKGETLTSAMASADLRKELECSVCLKDYTDPVTLKCGHNFCRVCIDRVLETQEEAGGFFCPECREEFQERPALIRNLKLRNIMENLLSTESGQSEVRVFCTYCIDSPVPAVKSCLLCEASLCERYLRVHSKSPEHVLTDPNPVLGNRKCSEHMEVWKYYCSEDSACVCVSCYVIGEHRGHQMEPLDKASERKKKALKDVLQKVAIRRKETEGRVQSLQEHRKEAQQKATDMCERVTALFRELRIQVTELEKRVLSEVSRQEQQASLSLSHLIQQLEIKKDELSRKMRHIEELCNTTDPLTLLQEPDTGDLCDTEEGSNEDRETHDKTLSDGGDLDMSLLSQQFHTLSDIIKEVNVGIYIEGAADILLDVDTAHNDLHISHDRKTVSNSGANQNRPETPKRFKICPQVLSSCSFSSGRHYWEVDVGGACWWRVGMCYPSIDRVKMPQSFIGYNDKSWALYRCHNNMTVRHDDKGTPLPAMISGNKVRICLDYEAGKISFYESAMASADLRKELECSVCLSIYTDPVTLKCGHNFCRVCIDRVLETQEGAGGYSCPDCREHFQERPALIRNITLCNIVENFLATLPNQEETGIFCSYCVDSPVPAVKSCLLCEASLCEKHLRFHNKSPEHVLTDPSTTLGNRKCLIHRKILEYYCTEDAACICVSCCLIGEHRGHQIESLDMAYEKKALKLRDVLQKVTAKREETQSRVQSLQEKGKKEQEIAASELERVATIFKDLRRQLEDLEKRVLSEISQQAEQASLSVCDLIQELEIKKDELSRKMRHIEELCNTTDPLTLLQEPDTDDLCDTEEEGNGGRGMHETLLPAEDDLDVSGISHTYNTLVNLVTKIKLGIYREKAADLLLDVNTAGHDLLISDDRKTASRSLHQKHPETAQRFQKYSQVLSSQSFSSGQHYWEVDVGRSQSWRVGMSYPSIDRRGEQSWIGENNKSWCLDRHHDQYLAIHESKKSQLPTKMSSNRIRICLDYEAGQIFFYDLCDPRRLLHTFTTSFTEPLHAAIYVWKGSIKISGGISDK